MIEWRTINHLTILAIPERKEKNFVCDYDSRSSTIFNVFNWFFNIFFFYYFYSKRTKTNQIYWTLNFPSKITKDILHVTYDVEYWCIFTFNLASDSIVYVLYSLYTWCDSHWFTGSHKQYIHTLAHSHTLRHFLFVFLSNPASFLFSIFQFIKLDRSAHIFLFTKLLNCHLISSLHHTIHECGQPSEYIKEEEEWKKNYVKPSIDDDSMLLRILSLSLLLLNGDRTQIAMYLPRRFTKSTPRIKQLKWLAELRWGGRGGKRYRRNKLENEHIIVATKC